MAKGKSSKKVVKKGAKSKSSKQMPWMKGKSSKNC